ncbi:hypothetical protein BDW72DRAFT_138068 [Aspergillus terricola var. indicus]
MAGQLSWPPLDVAATLPSVCGSRSRLGVFLWVLYLGCDMCIGPCPRVYAWSLCSLCTVLFLSTFCPSSFVQGSPEVLGWFALNGTWRIKSRRHYDMQALRSKYSACWRP